MVVLGKNTYIVIYAIYIVVYGVALMFNGEFFEYGFIKQVLAYFLVAIIAYYATIIFLKNERDIKLVYIVFISILVLTSVVTILQFTDQPIGWQIGLLFNEYKDGMEEKIYNYGLIQDNLLGASYAVGIFGHPVKNAMFIASIAILPLINITENKSLIKRLVYVVIFATSLIACFMTQQRSAFYILMLSAILISLYISKNKLFIITLGAFLIMVLWPTISELMLSENLGRLSWSNLHVDESRDVLWSNAIYFIEENLMWGGPMSFMRLNQGLPAHNFFLSAFIYGGLIGGLVIIFLFFKICKDAISITLANRQKKNYAFIFSISLIVFLIQGMFHNGTLIDGESLIFIFLAISITANKIQERTR